MASTFTRVNSVTVNPAFAQTFDGYLDPAVAVGGSYSSALATEQNIVATYGQLFRGMPVLRANATGKIVPPNAGLLSTSTTSWFGVLAVDVTAWISNRPSKIAVVKKGRVRTYAGGALTTGDPVKVDTSANFSGFVKWVAGTDDASLLRGYMAPINDGSDGNAPAVSAAQGDTIFVDLI